MVNALLSAVVTVIRFARAVQAVNEQSHGALRVEELFTLLSRSSQCAGYRLIAVSIYPYLGVARFIPDYICMLQEDMYSLSSIVSINQPTTSSILLSSACPITSNYSTILSHA
jgi:hypothetical protein